MEVESWGGDLGHEDGALMNGIDILIKETSQSSLTSSPTRGHNLRPAMYEKGSKFSPDPKYVGAMILDFPALRSMINVFVLFISEPAYGIFVIVALTQRRTQTEKAPGEAF